MVTIVAMPSNTRIGPKNASLARVYIREWREHLHLTQEQLADRIEVTKGTVSRWENDHRVPDIHTLAAIAEGLGVSTGKLYHPPQEQSLDDLAAPLPPDAKRQVLDMIDFLSRKYGN